MLLAEVVATSRRVASTPARSAKVASLAQLLGNLAPDEIEPAVAFLAGEPRQGKVGVGWATIVPLAAAPASEAVLTVADLDQAGDRLLECMLRTANGRLTAAEALGHREFVLTRLYESA